MDARSGSSKSSIHWINREVLGDRAQFHIPSHFSRLSRTEEFSRNTVPSYADIHDPPLHLKPQTNYNDFLLPNSERLSGHSFNNNLVKKIRTSKDGAQNIFDGQLSRERLPVKKLVLRHAPRISDENIIFLSNKSDNRALLKPSSRFNRVSFSINSSFGGLQMPKQQPHFLSPHHGQAILNEHLFTQRDQGSILDPSSRMEINSPNFSSKINADEKMQSLHSYSSHEVFSNKNSSKNQSSYSYVRRLQNISSNSFITDKTSAKSKGSRTSFQDSFVFSNSSNKHLHAQRTSFYKEGSSQNYSPSSKYLFQINAPKSDKLLAEDQINSKKDLVSPSTDKRSSEKQKTSSTIVPSGEKIAMRHDPENFILLDTIEDVPTEVKYGTRLLNTTINYYRVVFPHRRQRKLESSIMPHSIEMKRDSSKEGQRLKRRGLSSLDYPQMEYGTLVIKHLLRTDGGNFHCRVDFKEGPTRHSQAHLTVIG